MDPLTVSNKTVQNFLKIVFTAGIRTDIICSAEGQQCRLRVTAVRIHASPATK